MIRQTIKQGEGYHLYTSALTADNGLVYLDLHCDFAAFVEHGRGGVTVRLPEDMATRLGLLGWEGTARWRP